jgi:hypothetical protein
VRGVRARARRRGRDVAVVARLRTAVSLLELLLDVDGELRLEIALEVGVAGATSDNSLVTARSVSDIL